MSIIHEALKKAGREKDFQPGLISKKSKVNWGPIFVLLVLTLITGPILAPIFSSPFKQNTYVTTEASAGSTMSMTAPAHAVAQFAIEELPIPAPAALHRAVKPFSTMPNFSLSGIVVSSPDSYCLINGKVVKIGEEIDGAQLIAVSPEIVTLEYQGRQIQIAVD